MHLEMGWEMAYSLSCCLEAADKRINITANPDTERQCTQTSHQPPYFPYKLGNISVSKNPSPLLCVETGDRKSRTEKQRTRGGETEKEMEEQDTIDQCILAALFRPVPIKDKAANQARLARPLFHFSLKCKTAYSEGRSPTHSSDKVATCERSRMTGHWQGLWQGRRMSK